MLRETKNKNKIKMQQKNGVKTPDQLIGKLQIALKNIRNETENERK